MPASQLANNITLISNKVGRFRETRYYAGKFGNENRKKEENERNKAQKKNEGKKNIKG